MYCTQCGKSNLQASRFCGYCGAPLEKEMVLFSRHRDNIMNGEGLQVSYLKTVLLCMVLMRLVKAILYLWFAESIDRMYFSLGQCILAIASMSTETGFFRAMQTIMESLASQDIASKTLFILDCSFFLIDAILMLLAVWRIFKKAGMAGWQCLIPIWNFLCVLEIIFGRKWGTYLLYFILISGLSILLRSDLFIAISILVIAGIALALKITIMISQRFGHDWGFAALQLFFPSLFILIYGWGKDQYRQDAEVYRN